MIKKYFAMTIIAASVSLAACSSDDDDDDGGVAATDPTLAECTVDPTIALCATLFPDTQPSEATLTATVDVPAVTAYDVIGGATGTHSSLLAALNAVPALANAADDSDNPITVLAPDDAAFAAVVAATDGVTTPEELIAALTTDDASTADIDEGAALARILSYHVIPGVAALEVGTAVDTALVDGGVAVQLTPEDGTGGSGLAVTDDAGTTVDLAEVALADTGNVYTLTAVLTPPAAPVVDNSGGGDPVVGTAAAALIGDGTAYSEAGGAFLSTAGDGFPESLDNSNGNTDAFMFFVPSNAAMTTATLTGADLTGDDVKRHISTTVTALVAGETVSTVGATAPYAVAADADLEGGFTVGGFPVTLLGATPEGGEIYGIEGILP